MRATPKTSSPENFVSEWNLEADWGLLLHTFPDLRPERNVFGSSALDLLFGRHSCGFSAVAKVALSGDGCAKGVELMAQEHIC